MSEFFDKQTYSIKMYIFILTMWQEGNWSVKFAIDALHIEARNIKNVFPGIVRNKCFQWLYKETLNTF